MKIKFHLIIFFLLSLFFISFSAKEAFADTVNLSGSVKDNSGNVISGATVTVNDTNNDTATTDSSGNYNLSISSGTYNIQVTPPAGSNFSSAIALSQNITSNTILNFILTPSGTIILNGHVYDPLGNPVANQQVQIWSNGSLVSSATTDSSGSYSIQVSSGKYRIDVTSDSNPTTLNVPQNYDVYTNSYLLTQSTILNITVPVKKVTVHVQDSSGNPISNVTLDTQPDNLINFGTLSMGGGINNAVGSSSYGDAGPGPATDSSGNAVLWLLPNSSSHPYSIVGTPPNGSSFQTTSVTNVVIASDSNLTLTMTQPVTLSGHVYDPLGNPVANQKVSLQVNGSVITSINTDSSGSYSLQASPGVYRLDISATNNSNSLNVPQEYDIFESSYSLTQNTNLDITIPAKEVSFQVQDALGNPVSNVVIDSQPDNLVNTGTLSIGGGINNAEGSSSYGGGAPGPTTDTSGKATLWLLPNNGSLNYSFIATPPSGSSFSVASLSNVAVISNVAETLKMTQPVTLSGHVYDPLGNPVANQTIQLWVNGSLINSATTDNSGSYSIQGSTGTYRLDVTGDNNPPSLNVPQNYDIYTNSYVLTQNTTLDITIPVKKISFHVQDALGNPISNVVIDSQPDNLVNTGTLSMGAGINNAVGLSNYYSGSETDSSGNLTLWLLPNSNGIFYSFTANPSSGSVYNAFTLNNVSVTGNQTEVVSLQYNHSTPTTTATLSPSSFSDGLYADPTTVTLSASAASGYTIANTYYTIDGGSQQTYSSPFTVTGAGNHTITYWSVDNSGVTEATNTKTFTITEAYSLSGTVYNDANQNGFQDPGEQGVSGATVTLNTGQSTTTDSNGNYTFSNLESGTYTETLTVPTGYTATTINPVSVPLSANTTENFGIASSTPTTTPTPVSPVVAINAGGSTFGDFSSDTDYNGGSTFTTNAAIDTSGVTNPAPTAVYQSVRYGNFSYTIPNLTANGTYTLQLHFSEPYWGTSQAGGGGVGSRIFNVSVNGTQALTDFDVYQAAGGANKAVMEQIPATADSNGNITVTFSNVVDNAMVSGIAVYNGTLPSLTPSPTPTPVSSLAISAGGQGSGSYVADTDYTGGTTYNTTASIDTTGVTDPAPVAVYQNVRYGNTFSYTIPTYSPNTNYTVRLDFSEPYWNSAGSRKFNVSINGTQVLNNFDVYQTAGGENKAVAETFNTTSDSNGFIKIQFTTVTDNAMVSGIQVSQQ